MMPYEQSIQAKENICNDRKVTKQRYDKYSKYDNILGPSAELKFNIKVNRLKNYENANFHSMEELTDFLKTNKQRNNLIFQAVTAIPYSCLGLKLEPSEGIFKSLIEDIIDKIVRITGIRFIYKANNFSKTRKTFYALYICNKDIKGLNKGIKKSLLKKFDCKSYLKFRHHEGFGFVNIEVNHQSCHYAHLTPSLPRSLKSGEINDLNSSGNDFDIDDTDFYEMLLTKLESSIRWIRRLDKTNQASFFESKNGEALELCNKFLIKFDEPVRLARYIVQKKKLEDLINESPSD